ncbi:LegC family aminotransferase [Gammaproteobacteria bacterium]|nr:LegC family aminotransferase [Gammaproteobacteria bacterium]
MKNKDFVAKAKEIYGDDFIPLHRPVFIGNERQYLVDCIDSNFVSSVGEKVNEFEQKIARYTGSKYAIATVNGTAALHIAIELAGVKAGDEVISQSLTFIATCNAISYAGARPVFIDVDKDTLGMSPESLKNFLNEFVEIKDGQPLNKFSGKRVKACLPMHTFGLPCRIKEIADICKEWGIILIEDTAESLGSFVKDQHTGTFGEMATFSFNGNKVITTGGGGMLITNNKMLAERAKHISTTAKIPHAYEFVHDQIGYNYRMPNLNAALGCAQMERLSEFLSIKADVATKWLNFFKETNIQFVQPIDNNITNNWLNAIILDSKLERDQFLKFTNKNNVMTRPIWKLMSNLSMFKDCQDDGLKNSKWLEERIVNIPSSVPDGSVFNQLK